MSLANALIVIDAQKSVERSLPPDRVETVSRELSEFFKLHEDDYLTVVSVSVWEPDPGACEPLFPDYEFDRLLLRGRFGLAASVFEATINAVEPVAGIEDLFSLHGYLRRLRVGHLDFAGFGTSVYDAALEALLLGYDSTILHDLVAALDDRPELIERLVETGVHVDGWATA